MIKTLLNVFKPRRMAACPPPAIVVTTGKRKKNSPDLTACEDHQKPSKKPRFIDKYEGEYYFDLRHGLRLVYPYPFEYRASTKRRWVGEKILDIYKKEFRAYDLEHVMHKFAIGEITVNDQLVKSMDYRLKDGDVIMSRVHRHENPILATPVRIIHEDDQVLVINKPSSIPVHPCGKYRLNSVLALLYKEQQRKEVYIIHRIDRLTSGLLILAKTSESAKKISQQICGRTVSKEYVCKVDGHFPDGEIVCDQPIDRLCHKLGVHYVSKKGKPSLTTFKRISSDGINSIVHCRPQTGRTHQIRIHLQYLGYPIVNDPLYNSTAFGPTTKGKMADYEVETDQELIQRIYTAHPIDKWVDSEIDLKSVGGGDGDGIVEVKNDADKNDDNKKDECDNHQHHQQLQEAIVEYKQIPEADLDRLMIEMENNEALNLKGCDQMLTDMRERRFDPDKLTINTDCPDCKLLFKHPTVDDMYICLHALKYKTPEWEFFADPPSWAHMDKEIDFRNL